MRSTLPVPPAWLTTLAQALSGWLSQHPLFAQHPGSTSLHAHLAGVFDPQLWPAQIAQVQQDLLHLQVAFHEAGHAAASYALTSEEEVWGIRLWFPTDLTNEEHAGRAYMMERWDWPSTREEICIKLAVVLAGALFHPEIPQVQFSGGTEGDEATATALAQHLDWSLEEAYADARQKLDQPDLRAAVEVLAAEAFGRLAQGKGDLDEGTTAQILGQYLIRPDA
ncbi:hypothetical protein [Deinococcus sp. QL22]|uniref:hypothetical protein n=1 Tax=Deinococcus sp. QL22 TaxID=2939437 RepID=UPI0020173F5D|nr:hypothetical protein [Deinococcus sp. QL22]UQN08763.1 hypothetical protein M1R55_21855 [Deinococcus sp. QL22]